jgi:hypothetical protein
MNNKRVVLWQAGGAIVPGIAADARCPHYSQLGQLWHRQHNALIRIVEISLSTGCPHFTDTDLPIDTTRHRKVALVGLIVGLLSVSKNISAIFVLLTLPF